MKLSAIILAGGRSTRMKYNKEYIKIGNEYLVHQQIKKLQLLFDEIIVVSNNKKHYQNYKVKVVSDILEGFSPIIGLHSGLTHSSNDYNYIIACDMPFIDAYFITYLKDKISNHSAYVVKMNHFFEPFHAIYNKDLIPFIEELVKKEEFGFQNMVKKCNYFAIKEKDIAPLINKHDLFKNINNEEELYDIKNKQAKEYRVYEISKVQDQDVFTINDKIITEYPLSIYINNDYFMTMMTTPTNLEFLVIGYLYNEGVIASVEEIKTLKINLHDHKAFIEIDNPTLLNNREKVTILSSACGGGKPIDLKNVDKYKIENNDVYNLNYILSKVAGFNKESTLFKETGGVHSVKLVYEDEEVLIEDIGRHNAVDKIVGYILKNRLGKIKKFIITSGRVSSDILLKCAKSNIPLVVSRSAPTSLSVNLGRELGVTILGFARGKKVNIYSNISRIKEEVL